MSFLTLEDLDFHYPEDLVATEPRQNLRAMFVKKGEPLKEINKSQLLDQFQSGDILVVNNTKVLPRRIFTEDDTEILFVKPLSENLCEWEVLFPARKYKVGDRLASTGGIYVELTEKGMPQKIKSSVPLNDEYFVKHGQVALPPYIQKARGQRKNVSEDRHWYQTAWAKWAGSSAAPTASLHFNQSDLEELKSRGVQVEEITLHVGLGTFLPIRDNDLSQHKMHSEYCEINKATLAKIENLRSEQINSGSKAKNKVWALGTTSTRAIESYYQDKLSEGADVYFGETDLFITPGFEFKAVDVLMTNFHQPKSTLLALVGAFAGLDAVKKAYGWAIDRQFKLFSYGDLSVWML